MAIAALVLVPAALCVPAAVGTIPNRIAVQPATAALAVSAADVSLAIGHAPMGLLGELHRATSATQTPPGEPAIALSYDAADGYVLLVAPNVSAAFGGSWGPHLDTWAFLNGTWTLLTESAAPANRGYPSMTYDPVDHYVVLFGGYPLADNTTVRFYNDTWTFASGEWTNRTVPSSAPPARAYAVFTWDGADEYAFLHGGFGSQPGGGSGNLTDSWGYVGGNWTQILTNAGPPGEGSITYDAADGYVLYFGGAYPTPGAGNSAETWTYVNGTWANITAAVGAGPPARTFASLDYDGGAQAVVMFGGCCALTPPGVTHWVMLGDLWSYGAERWTLLASSGPVQPRTQAPMVYDPEANGSFLFGGWNGTGVYTDSWVIQLAPSGATPAISELVPALLVSTSTVTLGDSLTFDTARAFAQGRASYVYSGLPTGCASLNAPQLTCTPTATGTYTVSVEVTSGALGAAAASAVVQVIPSGQPAPGHTGASGLGPWGSVTGSFGAGVALGGSLALVIGAAWVIRERKRSNARRTFIENLRAAPPRVEPADRSGDEGP